MLIVVGLFFYFGGVVAVDAAIVVVATVATSILLAGSHASSYNMLLLNKFPKTWPASIPLFQLRYAKGQSNFYFHLIAKLPSFNTLAVGIVSWP